jgi:hypothetical protein
MIMAAPFPRGLGFNLTDYALFWPVVAVTVIAAVVAGAWAARAGRGRAGIVSGLVFSLGLIAAATLTPSRDALLFGIPGTGTCDLSHLVLPGLGDLRALNETGLNVILFVPLGATVGFASVLRRRPAVIAGSIALPFAIELVQLIVTPLGRACQGVDVVDNLTGLAIGLVLGVIAATIVRRVTRADQG